MPNWYAVMTNPRCELRAKAGLDVAGYETFLPTYRKERVRHRRRVEDELNLFPRYLFVHVDPCTPALGFYTVRTTNGVAAFVSNMGRPLRVPTAAVDALREECSRGAFDEMAKDHIPIDQVVRIKVGPYADFTARVVSAPDAKRRVDVLFELLGRENRIPMPLAQLEAAC